MKLRPCIKCGEKEDILVWDCGYSSFNVGGVRCGSCINETELNCGCSPKNDLIKQWNSANPTPKRRIQILDKEIESFKNKIKTIRKKQKMLLKHGKEGTE